MLWMQVLDEFYQNLQSVGVSAVTGEGMDDFFEVRSRASRVPGLTSLRRSYSQH